ncbi:MAG: hypothetical protein ACE5KE_12985, partial [Methanosarcinales archaeon]
MEGKCSRKRCKSFEQIGCKGCGFQHFDKILNNYENNQILKSLGDEYFKLCSERKRTSGRISLDNPIKNLFKNEIPELNELSSKDLQVKLTINGEEVDFKIKCDGAFQVNERFIFYEIKGYGINTNDILSAISAAILLKETEKYRNYLYYYIGGGLKRNDFFNKKRKGVYPYVRWAESKGFLKFYGIIDIG